MYVLHYAPDNASLAVRLALEELGVPYRAALVDRAAQAQEGAAYRAVAPTGLIPALETPHGAIFETGAILLWLADSHGGLAPSPDAPERGDFLKWFFMTATTLHADMRALFYPHRYAGGDKEGHRALTERRILNSLSLIEAALSGSALVVPAGRPRSDGLLSGPARPLARPLPALEPDAARPRGLPVDPVGHLGSRTASLRAAGGRGRGPWSCAVHRPGPSDAARGQRDLTPPCRPRARRAPEVRAGGFPTPPRPPR
jgi:glutathione S-transferase